VPRPPQYQMSSPRAEAIAALKCAEAYDFGSGSRPASGLDGTLRE
jgi:hypothetical protein